MWKHPIHLLFLIIALAVIVTGTAYGRYKPLDDDALIGWWACDEGSGSLVADSSPNGNDGTAFDGDLIWGPGIHGNAIQLVDPVLVEIPAVNLTLTESTMAGWIKRNGSQSDWASFLMTRGTATGFNLVSNQLAYHWNDTSASWSARPAAPVPDGEWTFCAVTIAPDVATFYINGVEMDTNVTSHASSNWNANIYIGGDGTYAAGSRHITDAWLDDVSLFSRALTGEEVADIMLGLSDPVLASAPSPMNEGTDIVRDVDLSWKAGEGATAHDVYFGTVLADVEAGDASTLLSEGQSGTSLEIDRMEFGQTYYWRVDEHNSEGIAAGEIWTFTVEPFAYAVEDVTVTTTGASQPGNELENIVNGSGLGADDTSSTNGDHMWMGQIPADEPIVFEFAFDQIYKLHQMEVWNYNVIFEMMLGVGVKDVTVEYSANGTDWTVLGDVTIEQGDSTSTNAVDGIIDFGGAAVQYVRMTVNSTYISTTLYGLSEVCFTYIPAQAREPQPTDGAVNITPSETLAWRAGREADLHDIYFSASAEAVIDETALVDSVAEATYSLADLEPEFGTTYYWKVNEANEAEAISVWEGNLWSFAVEDYALLDDFEAYTDDEGSRIYETWEDGWVNFTTATVGYFDAPFAEKSVVYSGGQSMPLSYDNAMSPYYAEAQRTFGGVDWDTNGADRLVVHYRGQPVEVVENADGSITVGAGGADIWDVADEFRFVYKQLNGDGTIVARVDSLANSNAWAKAGVMIRESLTDNSTHAMAVVTPTSGASFQRRITSGGTSTNTDAADIAAPYWVKLIRTGDVFTTQHSADGVTWTDFDSDGIEITMSTSVYIGLAVTSHSSDEMTSATFSEISTIGTVTGQWQNAAIGVDQPSNSGASMYVVVEDSAGKTAVVTHPDPEATLATAWQAWEIPYSELSAVNLNNVETVYIGIGDRDNPTAGGAGLIFIDDIAYGCPAPTPADITAAGDIVQGVPNDGVTTGDQNFGWPAAEMPDLAIDDDVNTKYLHFKGEIEPTGLQITPAVGATVVTGLTFTTANDATERDPITFELYGSKDSIDGPYMLIASGDIVDFAGETAWERFTMTTTEIAFDNIFAYSHYQIMFPSVRDAGSANSMQIAEIELLGVVAP